ncbi:acetyl-CoA carboxylase biotin carboxyl carrier protein [Rhodococcoides fascians]|uniref:acetyl-CoA carboxylase biotin carboxyl carrier protein n=1 Tax=Rhodococcoides fascians TaxID=1828 RepID=UPI00056B6E40|nr:MULTISPECIES: biotin/lipoyl-containing protein [Rhodococcus]OZF06304.1 acetyl-CoA carboxylase biotin carboxyl carrier protein subunit [Rhodococcus sp. 15-1189-1-1a]OZF21073.1 acetyl-CoA carboxylase biotin carboxyl carrier protein subunit [Rhodococcus sp. 14-2686-1-2]
MIDSTVPTDVTMRELTALVREFTASGWASMELDINGMHLVLGRDSAPSAAHAPAAASTAPVDASAQAAPLAPTPAAPLAPTPATVPASPVATPARTGTEVAVKSPVVGAFWVAPSPGEAPFVTTGQHVEAGQQLGIVEVMKLMSNVSSPVAGTIVAIQAQNADMVEYDQVLFLIEPDDK